MKYLIFALILISMNAYSLTPEIGQEVTFGHKFSIMGVAFDGVRGKRIESFNDDTNEFGIYFHSKYGNMFSEEVGKVHEISVNKTYIENTEEFCKNQEEWVPGELEVIKTRAGEFLTCRIDYTEVYNYVYIVWYSSDVPFGIVRKYDEMPDGDFNIRELLSYKK